MSEALTAIDRAAVDVFKKFISIRSISAEGANGSYFEAVRFLQDQVCEIGLQYKIVEFVKRKPVLIATWVGQDESLDSVLLNSHYDVVPVYLDKWSVDPFSAEEKDGYIFGRGTQDMKCVCIQHLEAVRRLKKSGFHPKRNIHLTFVPDEELGGADGMAKFVVSQEFKTLNVGIGLDEGLANPTNKFTVFYAERAPWWLHLRAKGPTGHGSRFIEGTAMNKLINSINHFLKFREEQRQLLLQGGSGCSHAVAKKLGDVVTINLTVLKGGMSSDGGQTYRAYNVIPAEAEAGFDIRIPPSISLEEFEEQFIKKWTEQEGVEYDFIAKTEKHGVTSIDPEKNKWWRVFSETCEVFFFLFSTIILNSNIFF